INIGSGAIVKFKRSSAGLQRQAPQNINLHPTAILTSYKDDAHGGDTNGDGSNSSPLKGDWLGLRNAYSNTPYWEQGSTIVYSTNAGTQVSDHKTPADENGTRPIKRFSRKY